jgi:two-component system KDP operon response regulator KdpE
MVTPPHKILVVDSDHTTGRMLHRVLESKYYRISTSRDSEDGLSQANKIRPDVVILDLDLPNGNGFRVLDLLWKWHRTRIIVLTWRADPADKVRALDSGAYDYVVKPFAPEEVAARVRVVLRSRPVEGQSPPVRSNLHINMANRQMSLDGNRLDLTAKEEAVLFILARHAGRLVSQKRLLRVVWGGAATNSIAELRDQIASLRTKLGKHSEKTLIHGGGYFGFRLATTVSYDARGAAMSPRENLGNAPSESAKSEFRHADENRAVISPGLETGARR